MNLTTDAWIPIVWNDAKPGTVSLCEAFERGHEIQDLAVRPHERISLMRLLICVAQTALDGPSDQDDWRTCRPRMVEAALGYLRRWRHAFELFGDGQRFLQVPNLKKPTTKSNGDDDDESNSTSKLDLALATGNNTTLFDNSGGSERAFTAPQLALMLTTFQCFSPCGTIGIALWNGSPTPGWSSYPKVKPGQSAHAPCISGNMLHSYLRARNLLDSLHCNLITKEQVEELCVAWGKPVWEKMPTNPTDSEAVKNATMSYLGRLVPLSRSVQLADDRRSMTLANGLEFASYADGWREPSATIVARTEKGQQKRVVLSASVDKAVWRKLHALTVKAIGQRPGGPLALQNISENEAFDLWVGGLVAEGNGKLLDSTESVFHVPAPMLGGNGQLGYEAGVEHAERKGNRLHRAVSTYRIAMESSERDLGGIKKRLAALKKPERDQLRALGARAAAQFWTDVEQALSHLLEIAEKPEKLGQPADWHKTDWGKAVLSGMRAAFERACPHETPRQMRAYALGLETLFAAPAVRGEVETEKEAEA